MTIRSYIRPKIQLVFVAISMIVVVPFLVVAFIIPVSMICFARWWNEEPVEFVDVFLNVIGGQL